MHVVGVAFPNKGSGGDRRLEILIGVTGRIGRPRSCVKESCRLNAVAVFSARDVQISYLNVTVAAWIDGLMRQSTELHAIFQEAMWIVAAIRYGLDSESPFSFRET